MDHVITIFVIAENSLDQAMIGRVVSEIPDAEVAGMAKSCGLALAMTKLRNHSPDMVLIDMSLASANGFSIIREMKRNYPLAKIVMINFDTARDGKDFNRATDMGASDFLPALSNDESQFRAMRLRFITMIAPLRSQKNFKPASSIEPAMGVSPAGVPVTDRPKKEREHKRESEELHSVKREPSKITLLLSRIDVVVIASSTGGPKSLEQVIPLLPETLGAPVLLVQHMPAHLTQSFISTLNQISRIEVIEGVEGDEIKPNAVYVAPGGQHMVVKLHDHKKYIGLNEDPPENSVRPSADVLFKSVADAYGGNILAVIMTGMGKDGVEGVRRMKKEGCFCLSQTEETCVVYGMSRSIDEAGLSDEKVPLEQLAGRIISLVQTRLPHQPPWRV
jgi:two-component system chemotaxis response regulator CheB